MNLTLHVWRQPGPGAPGSMVRYEVRDINQIELPESTYDGVWGVYAIHHHLANLRLSLKQTSFPPLITWNKT